MLNLLTTFASFGDYGYGQQEMSAGMIIGELIFYAIVYVVEALALMKMFEKAGVTGWYAFVPILNSYWVTKIATGNGWLFLLALIPCVGSLIYCILLAVKLSPAFGCGVGTTIGLIFIPGIMYLVLGFGSAQYVGPQ
jgi:hypothetical protein